MYCTRLSVKYVMVHSSGKLLISAASRWALCSYTGDTGTLLLLVLGIAHPLGSNGKGRIALGERRRSHDLALPVLAPALLQPQPRRGRMRHYVAANGLHRWPRKHAGPIQICCHYLQPPCHQRCLQYLLYCSNCPGSPLSCSSAPQSESKADLIGHHNRAAVFVRKPLQAAQKAAEANLARRQLPAPAVLHAVQRRHAVHNDEREARVSHH